MPFPATLTKITPPAQDTACQLGSSELLIAENKACDENGQEGAGSLNNRGFHTGGVGQAHIEEKVLQNGLEQGKLTDIEQGCFGRKKKTVAGKASH